MSINKRWDLVGAFLWYSVGLVIDIFIWTFNAADTAFTNKSAGFRLRSGFAAVAILGLWAGGTVLWVIFHPEIQRVEAVRAALYYGIAFVLYKFLNRQFDRRYARAI
jgi:hypothetical protein